MTSEAGGDQAYLDGLSAQELQYQVENFQAHYVHCIDSDALEELPEFFTDDCIYRVISRRNVSKGHAVAAIFCDSKAMVTDRIVSLRNANIFQEQSYRHIVSSTLVTAIEGNSVRAVSNYVVYRTQLDGRTTLYNAGCYNDRLVRQDGHWLFAEKEAVFDTDLIETLMVIPI